MEDEYETMNQFIDIEYRDWCYYSSLPSPNAYDNTGYDDSEELDIDN
jgi:hypothetical protein